MHKAAFLDRDGVINVDRGYVHRIEDFEFVPGTLQACRELARRGWLLVVATNQSGIGRGLYTAQDFRTVTDWMRSRFEEYQAPLAGVYYCPHHPTEALGGNRIQCDCRKPQPGMLLAKDGRAAPEQDCTPGLAEARFACLREAVASAQLAPMLGEVVDA